MEKEQVVKLNNLLKNQIYITDYRFGAIAEGVFLCQKITCQNLKKNEAYGKFRNAVPVL
jgi:hypothetical protein